MGTVVADAHKPEKMSGVKSFAAMWNGNTRTNSQCNIRRHSGDENTYSKPNATRPDIKSVSSCKDVKMTILASDVLESLNEFGVSDTPPPPNSNKRNGYATTFDQEDNMDTDTRIERRHASVGVHARTQQEPRRGSNRSVPHAQKTHVHMTNGRPLHEPVYTEMTESNISRHAKENAMIKESMNIGSDNLAGKTADQGLSKMWSQDTPRERTPDAHVLKGDIIRLSEGTGLHPVFGQESGIGPKKGDTEKAGKVDTAACSMATHLLDGVHKAYYKEDVALCGKEAVHRRHTGSKVAKFDNRHVLSENGKRLKEKMCEYLDTSGHHPAAEKSYGTASASNARFRRDGKTNFGDRSAGESGMNTAVEEQQRFKNLLKMEPMRYYVHSDLHTDKHSETEPDWAMSTEYDKIRSLHANIATKPDHEFSPDLGKSESLQVVESTVIKVLFLPSMSLTLQERRAWEVWRLGSFSEAGDLVVFAIRLAQTGFYYDLELKDIKCFSCGLQKKIWNKGEIPAIRHLDLSPDCQHANFIDDRNVPILAQFPLHRLPPSESDRPRNQSNKREHDEDSSAVDTVLKTNSGRAATDGQHTSPTVSSDSVITTDQGAPASINNECVTSTPHQVVPASINHESVIMTDGEGRSPTSHHGPDTRTANHGSSGPPYTGRLSIAADPFATSASTGNQSTSLTDSELSPAARNTQHPQPSIPVPAVADLQGGPDGQNVLQQLSRDSRVDLRRAASPSNASVSVRSKSFLIWPVSDLPSARRMVLAGFYYLGISDSVRCFYCGITLRHWKKDNDPWTVHVRFRFSCDYVRAIKGDDFVRQTLMQLARDHGEASDGEQSSSSSGASQNPSSDSASHDASSTLSSLPMATPYPTSAGPSASAAAPSSLPSPRSSTRSDPVSADPHPASVPAHSREHQTPNSGSSDAASPEAALSSNPKSQPGSVAPKSLGGGRESLAADGGGSKGLASADGYMGVAYGDGARASEVYFQTQSTLASSKHGAAYAAAPAAQDREPESATTRNGTASHQGQATGGVTNVSRSQDRSNEGTSLPTTSSSGAAARHQLCIGTSSYADSFPGAARPYQANHGVQNQANQGRDNRDSASQGRDNRGSANQGRDNRNSANQDRGGGLVSANLSSANAAASTLAGRPNSNVASSSQSASLQTDAEPSTMLQPASLPSTRPVSGNISEGRERATSQGLTTCTERPRRSGASRHVNVDSEEGRAYLQELQETNRRLRQRRTCRLCRRRDVETIFLPCGHLCTCATCAPTIANCCLCRARIRATAHVYLE